VHPVNHLVGGPVGVTRSPSVKRRELCILAPVKHVLQGCREGRANRRVRKLGIGGVSKGGGVVSEHDTLLVLLLRFPQLMFYKS